MELISIRMLNININIGCETRLAQRLRAIYSPYVIPQSDQSNFQLEIKINNSNNELPDWEHQKLPYINNVIQINTPGFHGELNINDHRGLLNIDQIATIHKINYGLCQILSIYALQQNGLLLHSACVEADGRAYFFLGHSGSGKSTVARLSKDFRILNDDLVGILPGPSQWLAYPLPFWHTKQTRPDPETEPAPVHSVYLLYKDSDVFLRKLSMAEAISACVSSVTILASIPKLSQQALYISHEIVQKVPFYELHFKQDNTFWDLIKG